MTTTTAQAPIAIVGVACRLPGARDTDEFWQVLATGRDTVTRVPTVRSRLGAWYDADPTGPADPPYEWGGFLSDIDAFDSSFFGVTAGRADRMDPQQRMLLEVGWEAMEDAGWIPSRLAGSATGVFVGASTFDYSHLLYGPTSTDGLAPLTCLNMLSANLAHSFDLRGPALTVDTACSSSMVALHQAVHSVRSGECERAVVAGSNLVLDPTLSLALARGGMLSPDGRCKAFGAGADGYVRSEGIVVVLIRPLADALADGDPVHAVLRGIAVNQDGRTDAITTPSARSQVAVIEDALADAGLDASAIGYVECHGTGTLVGDSVETTALSTAMAATTPLPIGSVKSNIGHAEAASGLVGLLKTVLMLRHRTVPPTLHCERPSPRIAFDELGLAPVRELHEWTGDVLRAGVNSFGFGGTNGHAVVEEPPRRELPGHESGALLLPLSARTSQALRTLSAAWAEHLDAAVSPAEAAADVRTAATRRTHHAAHRVAVTGGSAADLAERLRAIADEEHASPARAPRVAFLFTGQGRQHPGMAADLLRHSPVFARTVARCDRIVRDMTGHTVTELLTSGRPLTDTALAQPCLVAIQLGLVELWRSVGVTPAAVAGHSSGEMAAAVTAGALGFDDAVRLAVDRGRAMAPAAGTGRMLTVDVDADRARALAATVSPEITVAAVNGPASTVLTGPGEALDRLSESAADEGLFARSLPGDYPFHGPLMADAARAITDRRSTLVPRTATVPMYSTVTGERCSGDELDDSYWGRNISDTVRFAPAVDALLDDGADVLLEVGPDAVLVPLLRQIVLARPEEGRPAVVPGLVAGQADDACVLAALGTLYEHGADVRWDRLYPAQAPARSGLPSYPWEQRRHWVPAATRSSRLKPETPAGSGHPLLRKRLDLPAELPATWEGEVGTSAAPEFLDHMFSGRAVLPGTAYIDILVRAGRELGLGDHVELRNLTLSRQLRLDAGTQVLRVALVPDGDGWHGTVYGRPARDEGGWHTLAAGRVGPGRPDERVGADIVAAAPDPDELETMSRDEVYAILRDWSGMEFGPSFRTLREVRRSDAWAAGRAALGSRTAGANRDAYELDPRLLDASMNLSASIDRPDGVVGIPVGIDRVAVDGVLRSEALLTVRVSADASTSDLLLRDAGGVPRCLIEGVRVMPLRLPERVAGHDAPAVPAPVEEPAERPHTYQVQWRASAAPDPAAAAPGRWLLVGADPVADGLAERIRALGGEAVVAVAGDGLRWLNRDRVTFDPDDADGLHRLLADVGSGADRIRGVVHTGLPGAEGPDPASAAERDTAAVLGWLQAVNGVTPVEDLWLLTRDAHGPGGRIAGPGASASVGLLRGAQLELRRCRYRTVDLDATPVEHEPDRVLAELTAEPSEAEIVLRGAERWVRRLEPTTLPGTDRIPVDPSATYVVTGGTGGLGRALARRLAERGATSIHLFGLSGLNDETAALTEELAGGGVRVEAHAVDCGSRVKLANALDAVRAEGRPLRGVVHAAGTLADGSLLRQNGDSVQRAFWSKVHGAWHLHELTDADPLDWFVLYSSAAAVLGSIGQANYCAANAFLDALGEVRTAAGQPVQVLNWGPWGTVGMAVRAQDGPTGYSAHGLGSIAVEHGLDALEAAIARGGGQHVVLPFRAADMMSAHPAAYCHPFLSGEAPTAPTTRVAPAEEPEPESEPATAAVAETPTPVPTAPPAVVSGAPTPADGSAAPRTETEKQIAEIWRWAFDVDGIGVRDDFTELGGDSVFAFQILTQIAQSLGARVEPEQAFEDFTIEHLARLVDQAA